MIDLALAKLGTALMINVTAAKYEAHFVGMPGHVSPVGLEILQEDCIELEILPHLHEDLL